MSLALQKDLPMSVCPLDGNPDGEKFQAKLKQIDKDFIAVYAADIPELRPDDRLEVEFRVDKNSFHFETALRERNDQVLFLRKPKVIHKNRIREHARATYRLSTHFTLWTETGRFEGTILDMTEDGIRLETRKPMRRGTLISLDFYIKAEKIRVITQGLVAWCVQNKENEYLFESGVQFTTISNEAKKKLARYCEKIAPLTGATETTAAAAGGSVVEPADDAGAD